MGHAELLGGAPNLGRRDAGYPLILPACRRTRSVSCPFPRGRRPRSRPGARVLNCRNSPAIRPDGELRDTPRHLRAVDARHLPIFGDPYSTCRVRMETANSPYVASTWRMSGVDGERLGRPGQREESFRLHLAEWPTGVLLFGGQRGLARVTPHGFELDRSLHRSGAVKREDRFSAG